MRRSLRLEDSPTEGVARGTVMKPSDRYLKFVEWSEVDRCYIGVCPGLILGGLHGDNEAKVYAELCRAVEEWIAIHEQDGTPLPPPTAGKVYSGKFVVRVGKELHQQLAIRALREAVSLNSYCARVLREASASYRSQKTARQAVTDEDAEDYLLRNSPKFWRLIESRRAQAAAGDVRPFVAASYEEEHPAKRRRKARRGARKTALASKDPDMIASVKALRRAARRALELGLSTGTPVYVMKAGRIVDLTQEASAAAPPSCPLHPAAGLGAGTSRPRSGTSGGGDAPAPSRIRPPR